MHCRWKGSLYKLVWLDLTIYLTIYYLIHIIYRYALSFEQKQTFNTMVVYCEDIAAQLPVSFVLGFFVSGIINRWFQTFMHIPWLHEITYNVMTDKRGRWTPAGGPFRRFVMQAKGRIPPADTSGVIYRVNCLDCPANYCGLTDKRLSSRMHEHTLAVRRKDIRSHFTMHSLENNHRFDFDGAQLLGRAEYRLAREVIEAWQSDANFINSSIYLPVSYEAVKHNWRTRRGPLGNEAAVNGADPRVSRKIRHCVMRYLNLAWILTMRRISDRIADRFHRQINATSGSPKNSNKSIIRGHNGIWSVSQNSNAKKPVQKRNKSGNKITPVTASPLEVQPNSEIFHLNENDNTFNETDEWSIKETLRCFNNDKIVQATFGAVILEKEINAFEEIARQHFQKTHKRYIPEAWIPIQWAVRLINKAGLHANITDPKLIPNVIKVSI
ncbi:unnamed protein product [Schistocephalus solidus]|uniref:Bestrophin homolog n=1 Tax=Schistocephalus solidus TaxID=70667 RepID=A0A3P7CJ96_SCHSO|nr:unnamed protein product [Schistocephalus solidus]